MLLPSLHTLRPPVHLYTRKYRGVALRLARSDARARAEAECRGIGRKRQLALEGGGGHEEIAAIAHGLGESEGKARERTGKSLRDGCRERPE